MFLEVLKKIYLWYLDAIIWRNVIYYNWRGFKTLESFIQYRTTEQGHEDEHVFKVDLKATQLYFFLYFTSSVRLSVTQTVFTKLVLLIERGTAKADSINGGEASITLGLSPLPELLRGNVASSQSSCLQRYYGNWRKPTMTPSKQSVMVMVRVTCKLNGRNFDSSVRLPSYTNKKCMLLYNTGYY